MARHRLVLCSGALLLASLAETSDFSIRPVFYLGAAYDSNVLIQPGEPAGDYFGSLGVSVPIQYKIGPHSGLSASYLASGEWYRDLTLLSKFPTRQAAALAYAYDGRSWRLGLNGTYGESERPEEVFPETGIPFARQRVSNAGGGLTLGRKLGQHGSFGLNYVYGRSLYSDLNTDSHSGGALLGRQFGPRTTLDVRYSVQLHAFAADDRTVWQTAIVGWTQGLGRRTSLRLGGGVRFEEGSESPEAQASLSHQWRRSNLSLAYSKTHSFVPTSVRFTDSDNATLSFGYQARRFHLALSTGYYRNHSLDQAAETYRGSTQIGYALMRWVGLNAGYQYSFQKGIQGSTAEVKRHTARLELALSPWAERPGPAR